MSLFQIESPFPPAGDQPQAIESLVKGIRNNERAQVLMGVTGSGKTFTMAHVIAQLNRPTLVMSHNKTLTAQLYSELKEFFPHNAVEYFVSYYDYYQPEAYIPHTDLYIEKDSSVNDELDRLRLSATTSLMSREDVIIVASVSCIYNLGSPKNYRSMLLFLEKGQIANREEVMEKLVAIQYDRTQYDLTRGSFRVRGDVLEILPAYSEKAFRIEWWDDEIERIAEIHPVSGNILERREKVAIYPAKHFVMEKDSMGPALKAIKQEMIERVRELNAAGKLVEAQRLESRTLYDLEMLEELGFCHGVENYSRHLSGREPGSRPDCLLDYFPPSFLTFFDESHVTIPQVIGMYEGDRVRKSTLVEYGFRLPSCLDNRPLRFEEFNQTIGQQVFMSATPAKYELTLAKGRVVEQIVRPTGLVDPPIEVRPTEGQVDDLVERVRERAKRHERVLVTTLTKRMAEDLSGYLQKMDLRVKYLHSDIGALERVEILRDLRLRKFDCLVGVNLLREGLDLPEVSLVAVLDADKEGFLRSQTSLIQVSGRAARNINGEVVLYADRETGSMQRALEECNRRRKIQEAYNKEHNITPRSIQKAIRDGIETHKEAEDIELQVTGQSEAEFINETVIADLQAEMERAARNLHFERAALIRDQIKILRGESDQSKAALQQGRFMHKSRKTHKNKRKFG
ncbi:MAG: excinuclease ABC subunit UvrB [Candidatus Omnitrophica bacterium]|nr:excinuclease ABC subunit UvrB [Candidatus Omnitrophota bacterium]